MPGDEEEDGVDDLENEFNWDGNESQYGAESLHGHMTYGRGGDLNGVQQPFQLNPNVRLLTNGQMVPAILRTSCYRYFLLGTRPELLFVCSSRRWIDRLLLHCHEHGKW